MSDYDIWGNPPPHQQHHQYQPGLQLEHHYPLNGAFDPAASLHHQPAHQNQQQPQQRTSRLSPGHTPTFPNLQYALSNGFHFGQNNDTLSTAMDGSYATPQPSPPSQAVFADIPQLSPPFDGNAAAAAAAGVRMPYSFTQGAPLGQQFATSPLNFPYSLPQTHQQRGQADGQGPSKRAKPDDDVESDGENDGALESPNGEDQKPKPLGACARCKNLKVKCEFKTDPNVCKRCLNGRHECVIPGRKKRRAPPKREHLLNQIRDQAAQIQQLMEQLEAANSRAPRPTAVRRELSIGHASLLETPPPQSPAGGLSFASDTDVASPRADDAPPRPDVAAWIARARESLTAFGGVIGDAGAGVFADDEDGDGEGSAGADSEDDYAVDVVEPEEDDEERRSAGAAGSSRGGSPTAKERKASTSSHLAPLPTEAAPYGLFARMAIKSGKGGRSSRGGSVDPEEINYGVTAPDYFESRRRSVPDPAVLAPTGRQAPHILTSNIVTPHEVEKLFAIYFDYMNLSCSLLDPILYTAQSTYWRSPFLFTVICAIASRYYSERPELYDKLIYYAQLAAGTALINGPKSVEVVCGYILLSLYPVPMRRWEEDRTWLYLGLAIRVATDLNLNRPNTAKPRNEQHAREMLNRTRIWLNCHNLDRSTSSWHGKAPTIADADYVAVHSEIWYNSSEFNVPNFDIHLACYNAELRVMSEFKKKIYSDPEQPSGLNKNMDIDKLATETDERLESMLDVWSERLKRETDPNDPQARFRSCLILLAYSYSRLVVLSFGFQYAFGKGREHENPYFHRCLRAASDVVRVFIDDLSTQKIYLRHGVEAQCVFVTFASAFLIKLLHPKYASYLNRDERLEIHRLLRGIIDLLSSDDVVVDDRHGPKLWSRFLEGMLATPMAKIDLSPSAMKGNHTLPRRKRTQRTTSGGADALRDNASDHSSPAAHPLSPPPPNLPVPVAADRAPTTCEQSPNVGFAAPASAPAASTGQNALQMTFPDSEFFQPPLGFDNDFLQSMQSMEDPSVWQNMTMPGFSWIGALQTSDMDSQMNTIDPGLLDMHNTPVATSF